ncbi:non-hydrolyzing UDP-N-acetylglucosamine 2-epimerase [Halomarina litorea]|uniref:non-hydrolyzing UDP-N-acetylglucosamine 2-epimerase n=1 Tax=Halomarina litorea TaxID=2961595 RepID=UPI0020C36633|nr:UDP-N-acetylglucosamine 2-epimerase (non-hydrolyzing) [Halomarina sp. BCD28]
MRELAVVVGTRPEIIKMAPVIRAAEGRFDLHLVHTGQHYDPELSGTFFESLDLPTPDENLAIGSGTQAEQTGQALVGVESMLADRDPAAAIAQGDTNAVLSTALAAAKLPVAFGHVEAGLRSFDRTMPEEVNRVVSDHVADFSFAPTDQAVSHLESEGVTAGVFRTGNTVVDACREHAPLAAEHSTVRSDLGLAGEDYVVATIHRPSNTDDSDRLRAVVDTLDDADAPVVLPAHPRTRSVLDGMGYDPSGSLRLVDPLDYLDFLDLLANARVAVTDSGGIQEEASILEVPCLTVRPNTERPETVEAGVNELVGPETLAPRLEALLTDDAACAAMTGHPDLYGDGRAGERIVDVLAERV